MATISHLPAELVEYIYAYLAQPELNAVSRVNTGSNALAVPFLYRNVDLFIGSGDKVPRIDRFCMNILKDERLAARVETIRLGPSSKEGVKEGQRWIPRDANFDDTGMKDLIAKVLDKESLVSRNDYLRDALLMREYAAYASLILMVLPSLRKLYIADFNCATLDHLHTVLRNLDPGSDWNRRHASGDLMQRLSSISAISYNVDDLSGNTYPMYSSRFNLIPMLNLPNITRLDFSVPDRFETRARPGITLLPTANTWTPRDLILRPDQMGNVTTMVIRHSDCAYRTVQSCLSSACQLQSFTYEFLYDCKERSDAPSQWLDLSAWSSALPKSLRTLVMSVENCDTAAYPFKQPRMGDKLYGYLDLTYHTALHTLEVPFPFLTGDPNFSITTEIYPLLPPNLRHLSLRTDMTNAQHQFPFDTSVLSTNLTFQESEDEARHLVNARMDVSYMFHAAMTILDFATNLDTISVWQPADASLEWFDGQVADFSQTCRNKYIKGHLVYPMIMRKKKLEHWNLVKQATVYDPSRPDSKRFEAFFRGERAGIPLGLASQYHLHALRNHLVRVRLLS
ncbi:hypothetical protein CC86DRAFT_25154 [Ophiobolus disseminans]|uniref:F-box domain-containing protein n=1 Tax=Ophiobolus disseminans TaxID=1469910 RepID=A0A6A7A007_9PLEO|nr:hypothetical protein CC86DRAFT_25154 [Ophiobolus disseminans]